MKSAWLRWMPGVFVFLWSTGFIVARFGMPHAPPMKFLALRYAFSILCFSAWVLAAGVRWPQGRTQWLHLSVTGVLMHGVYLGGVWSAVKLGMGAGLAALLVGLQPMITAIWVSSRGHRVSAAQWSGLALGLLGLLMVVWQKLGRDEVNAANLAWIFAALAGITAGTLYQKRFVAPCDARSANLVQLLAALAVTSPLALMELEGIQLNAEFIGALTWSVLGLTLGGSSLLYLLIQRGAATQVTSLLYLVPPTTALMAWAIFGESIAPLTMAGIGLTALGVGIVVRR
ncbi:MAG: DMT family transporter [Paucibacter sp.]|nr:DMT family transporter [Roseateles sp.]